MSFDDDRLAELPLEQLGLLLEEYYRHFPELRGREEVHWFLDEIQLVPGWERFVRRAIDSEIVEIAVSGSSARMLSREVHTSLRHRGEEPGKEPARWTSAERSLVEKRFREYLVEGGFPEAQGHGVAKDTAHAMFGHLLDAFLISAVTLATDSERRRNSNPRKVYPVDAGLIGAFDAVGRANLGHSLETVVSNEMESRKARVGYVKTGEGYEVDFHVRYLAGGEELVQVCADPSDPATMERELRALEEAAREHRRAKRRLLVLTRDQVPAVTAPGVLVQPAYEWLLSERLEPQGSAEYYELELEDGRGESQNKPIGRGCPQRASANE